MSMTTTTAGDSLRAQVEWLRIAKANIPCDHRYTRSRFSLSNADVIDTENRMALELRMATARACCAEAHARATEAEIYERTSLRQEVLDAAQDTRRLQSWHDEHQQPVQQEAEEVHHEEQLKLAWLAGEGAALARAEAALEAQQEREQWEQWEQQWQQWEQWEQLQQQQWQHQMEHQMAEEYQLMCAWLAGEGTACARAEAALEAHAQRPPPEEEQIGGAATTLEGSMEDELHPEALHFLARLEHERAPSPQPISTDELNTTDLHGIMTSGGETTRFGREMMALAAQQAAALAMEAAEEAQQEASARVAAEAALMAASMAMSHVANEKQRRQQRVQSARVVGEARAAIEAAASRMPSDVARVANPGDAPAEIVREPASDGLEKPHIHGLESLIGRAYETLSDISAPVVRKAKCIDRPARGSQNKFDHGRWPTVMADVISAELRDMDAAVHSGVLMTTCPSPTRGG